MSNPIVNSRASLSGIVSFTGKYFTQDTIAELEDSRGYIMMVEREDTSTVVLKTNESGAAVEHHSAPGFAQLLLEETNNTDYHVVRLGTIPAAERTTGAYVVTNDAGVESKIPDYRSDDDLLDSVRTALAVLAARAQDDTLDGERLSKLVELFSAKGTSNPEGLAREALRALSDS